MKLKNFAITAAVLAVSTVSTSAALSSAQLATISRQVKSSKVAEAPALVTKLVTSAAKEDKSETAVAAFVATFKAHPATLSTALTAAIKAAPEATDKLVEVAIGLAPESGATVVRTAVEANPDQAQAIRTAAAKADSKKTAIYDREIAASSASRRVAGTAGPVGAAFGGGTVTVTPLPDAPPPTQVYAQPGGDSRRQP